MTPKANNESKNNHVGLHKIKKLLCSKRTNQQNRKTTYGMGEGIFEPYT